MVKTEILYDLEESVIAVLFAVPFAVVAVLALVYFLNAFFFYKQLTALIKRRYKDSVEWEQVRKYLEKFQKIHRALQDIEQFKPILIEISKFLAIDFGPYTYEQVVKTKEEMKDLDKMLPNLDDLELATTKFSSLKEMDKMQNQELMNIVESRSNMTLTDIVGLIKSRVSIFGIYNLHDDLELKHTKLGAEIKTANAKLEFLYR